MPRKQMWLWVTIALLSTYRAFGGGMEVYPSGGTGAFPIMPNRAVSSSSSHPVRATFKFKCLAHNNRAPIVTAATDGCLRVVMKLKNRTHPIDVSFPGAYLDPHGIQLVNPTCQGTTTFNGKWQGMLNFTLPSPPTDWHHVLQMEADPGGRLEVDVATSYFPETVSISDSGAYNLDARATEIESVHFYQTGIIGDRNGYYFGQNVEFPANWETPKVSANGQEIFTEFAVYGAAYAWQPWGIHHGFCGGFYSPLMLFFDKQRPKFQGIAMFPLISEPHTYAWPEANAPGYFLAIDKNHNGKIDSGEEMFGLDAKGTFKNGFEKLKTLDANHDGVIDAKDPMFSQLMLWKDQNGNGVTNPGELIPLSAKRVVKIELNYTSNTTIPAGGGAELREKATFYYYDDSGALKKGEVYDVWLAPLATSQLSER